MHTAIEPRPAQFYCWPKHRKFTQIQISDLSTDTQSSFKMWQNRKKKWEAPVQHFPLLANKFQGRKSGQNKRFLCVCVWGWTQQKSSPVACFDWPRNRMTVNKTKHKSKSKWEHFQCVFKTWKPPTFDWINRPLNRYKKMGERKKKKRIPLCVTSGFE